MARGRPDYGLLTIPTVLQNVTVESVTSLAGGISVDHSTVPTANFRYYVSASMDQTGAQPRGCTIFLVPSGAAAQVIASTQVLEGSASVNTPGAPRGPRWSLISTPATGSLATVTRPAAAGFLHVCESISFSARATIAPAATGIGARLIDGVSGGAAELWHAQLQIAAAIGQSVPPFSVTGLFIAGSSNTAMTLEFSAGLANLDETVTLSGYDIEAAVDINGLPRLCVPRTFIAPPGSHLRFRTDGMDATGTIESTASYVQLDFTNEIPNL